MSEARAISLKTYRPLVVVSLIEVVFVVLTTPFTRKATTPTISRHATPKVTTISTIVNPTGSPFFGAALSGTRGLRGRRLMGSTGSR
jgi:hypothetical protein